MTTSSLFDLTNPVHVKHPDHSAPGVIIEGRVLPDGLKLCKVLHEDGLENWYPEDSLVRILQADGEVAT